MLLRVVVLLGLALHISVHAFAQDNCKGRFTGIVLDHKNKPIFSAGILLSPGQAGQASDSLGRFSFSNLCPGRYTVTIQSLGYQEVRLDVVISNDEVTRTIRLFEQVTELDEVIVQHHDESHTEHAMTYSLLEERKLAELAGKSLGESLKEISGVNSIQTGPGIFKPVIHGVHSQRVLILNHGIRQEGQQWGAEHAPEIDPFIASNVVVIKDASAIKYGTDALGGVIVVNPPPLPETNKLGGMLNTVLQSNGRSATLSGMLEGGIAKHQGWGWRVQGTAKRTGDFSTPDYVLTNTGVKELNFSAAAGYHEEKKGFDIFFSRFNTEIGILKGTAIGNLDDLVNAMERDVPAYTTDFSYKISAPRQEVSHNLLKLNGHYKTGSGEWRWQYGFQNNNRKEFDMRIGDQRTKIPSIDLQLNTHSADVQWETHHSDKGTLSGGVSGIFQTNRNIYGTQRIPFIPNFTNISGGTFVISKLFLNTWTIDAGVRYDYRNYTVKGFDSNNSYYNDEFNFNNVSATVGVNKTLGAYQSLSASISSAWRPPHVAELYSIGTHQSAAAIEYGLLLSDSSEIRKISDVNFKTEQAMKVVTTYRYAKGAFTLEASPYFNYIFNYIYLQPKGITRTLRGVYPYFRYQQTDALFLGIDISASWQVAKYLQLSPQVSLLRASDEVNNDYFVFIPSNRYQLTLRYERPALGSTSHFYLESKVNYVARQGRAPRVVTVSEIKTAQEQGEDLFGADPSNFDFLPAPSGYWLWNIATGFSVKREKVQYDFRLASENTLNQQYREYTNRFRYYADDLGRNIILSLKCIF